jgi:density-regulated protein DRP1
VSLTKFFLECTLPPEFCSYGQKDISECKKWLEATHPVLFKQIYKVEAQQTEVKEVKEAKEGKEGKEDDQIDSLKENEGAEPKPEKKKVVKFGKEKGIQGEIKVFKQHRGGKKVISQIVGLNHYTKDLKALAKQLGKKFSCGASVATDDQYGECVSVQGDVEERLIDLIETDKDLKLLEIPIEKITFDDTGNKKGRKRV